LIGERFASGSVEAGNPGDMSAGRDWRGSPPHPNIRDDHSVGEKSNVYWLCDGRRGIVGRNWQLWLVGKGLKPLPLPCTASCLSMDWSGPHHVVGVPGFRTGKL